MSKEFIVLHDRLIVQPMDKEETSKGGIILSTKTGEKCYKGKVIRVGAGKLTDAGVHIPMMIQVGDIVHYSKFAAKQEFLDIDHFEEKELICITQGDVQLIERGE